MDTWPACLLVPRSRCSLVRARGSLWGSRGALPHLIRVGSDLVGAQEPASWAEQLRRDLDGMGLWEAWYLAMDREIWRESARYEPLLLGVR